MPNSFEEKLRGIVGRDPRYDTDGYRFLYEALDHTLKRIGERRHVSGRELSEGVRDLALDQFGGLARLVFDRWGIRATSDLGDMVYNLIEAGLMSRSDTDSREDFDDVYDFGEAFRFEAAAAPPRRSGKASS